MTSTNISVDETEIELVLSPSCKMTAESYMNGPAVYLEYTEHSSDHWHSDRETCVEITPEVARKMIKFLTEAFIQ